MQNMKELCDRIIRAVVYVTSEMTTNTQQETEYCLDVCHATEGANTKIYWGYKKLCEV